MFILMLFIHLDKISAFQENFKHFRKIVDEVLFHLSYI